MKRLTRLLLILSVGLFGLAGAFIFPVHAQTQAPYTATWSWTAPTLYTDGTAIPATTAITYDLYVGTAGPQSESPTPVKTGLTALTYTTSGYTAGQVVCGRVSAVVSGLESAQSIEACKTFLAVPKAPASLTVK